MCDFVGYLLEQLDFSLSELEDSQVMKLPESGCVERIRELVIALDEYRFYVKQEFDV